MHTLINADCLDFLNGNSQTWTTCFCDPPDNIGLGYQTYKDKLPDEQYVDLLSTWLHLFVYKAKTVWFSFNAKWSFEVGASFRECSAEPVGWKPSPASRPSPLGSIATTTWETTIAHCCDFAGPMHHCGPTPSACRVGGKRTATSGLTRAGECRATCLTSLVSWATASSAALGTPRNSTRAWSSDA